MKNPFLRRALPLAVAVLVPSLPASARLVAWYPLDEAQASSDPVDEIVAGNAASTIGLDPDPGLSFITRGHPSARPNLGTSYLITKGGGLDLGRDPAVQPTDKFTISFWFQPLTFDAFDRFLESQVGNSNGQDGLRIDTGGNPGNRIRVLVRDANGVSNSQFTHPLVLKNDGTWYFFAFRYDSDGINNSPFQLTVVEVTGDPVDEAAITAATAGPANVNTGAIGFPHAAIGTLIGVELPDASNANNLHAALDEVAFFDDLDGGGVLSDLKLADVYNFGPSGVELIASFSSDVESVVAGNPATLSWEVNDPIDTLILDDGLGNTTDLAPLTAAGAGTFVVNPTATTTYYIRATRGDAANVSAVRILADAAPDILTFSTSARLMQSGGSVDLTWSVTGADSLALDPGALDVSALSTINVSPAATTTYTLSATNAVGTSIADVTVVVTDGPVPAHRYVASTPGNDTSVWRDEVAARDWTLSGVAYDLPLFTPSPNTNISAAYFTGGGIAGGATPSFQYSEFTAEVWIRPATLTADHEAILETGGGQNGVSVLVNEEAFRFLGSSLDARTLDVTIPIAGLNLDDFVQIVFSVDSLNGEFEATVSDTSGTVRTISEFADILIGGNGAGLFVWASGALGVSDTNLGGRTDAAGTSPVGLTGFTGEIAIVNIYDRILDATDMQAAFDEVAPVAVPSSLTIKRILHDSDRDTLTVTWRSTDQKSYDAQFSTNLEDWSHLAGPFLATSDETIEILNVPPNQDVFFVRIREIAP